MINHYIAKTVLQAAKVRMRRDAHSLAQVSGLTSFIFSHSHIININAIIYEFGEL